MKNRHTERGEDLGLQQGHRLIDLLTYRSIDLLKVFTFVFLILVSAAAISLSICVECRAADGSVHLESGLKAYREEADFDKAVSELQEAVRLGLDNRTDLIQAHLYLGFAYIGKGQRMAAETEFAKAIKLDPTLSLDPKLHSTKTLAVFNETKARLVDSLTVVSVPGGAEVYLDDQSSGVTPLRLSDVLIGEHVLRIVKEYHQAEVLSIRVEKGKDNRVQVQLSKIEVEVVITSQPPEAAVYVAEKYDEGASLLSKPRFSEMMGRTPLSVKITLDQELAIKLAKEEFLDRELKLRLTERGVSTSDVEDIIPIEDGVGSVHVELSPAPPPGSLRIISDPPGATVHLDSITMGETPLTIAKVTPGVRRLRVSIPGFASVTKKVEVTSAGEATIEVSLGGRLNILSVPSGAQIFIDEEYVGVTPLRTGRIPAGSHQLRLAKKKHKDKLNAVVVERGQEKEVKTRLLAMKGSMAVSSDPPGAAVYLDGESRGNTPLFIYGVMVGQHSLKLVSAGYEEWETQITVEELKVSWQFGKLSR